MLGAIARLFGSSTFLSAVLSIVAQILCSKQGIEIPTEAVAAVPLAVAWKEGKRREAEAAIATAASRKEPLDRAADALERYELGMISSNRSRGDPSP